ncbi:hypothetical protein IWQ60_002928 [Tieghemiomyces parasiticus]|uniref:Large ribosomal subunit protein bL28m n=1 Tax=Tieghemiomyces parasiticus TaxID=78921 RepID=A0A9W8DV89_9FUNG|nr:hypothetical protein IWQ60_002928 [Tieghemiomyces parasiticus]
MLSLRRLAFLGRKIPRASLEGLYGGKGIVFGDKVAKEWESKTRRMWKPNVQWGRLHSRLLGETLRIRVTAHLLRTVDKHGGLDNYLLRTRNDKIASTFGVTLKERLTDVLKERNLTPLEYLKQQESGIPRIHYEVAAQEAEPTEAVDLALAEPAAAPVDVPLQAPDNPFARDLEASQRKS